MTKLIYSGSQRYVYVCSYDGELVFELSVGAQSKIVITIVSIVYYKAVYILTVHNKCLVKHLLFLYSYCKCSYKTNLCIKSWSCLDNSKIKPISSDPPRHVGSCKYV